MQCKLAGASGGANSAEVAVHSFGEGACGRRRECCSGGERDVAEVVVIAVDECEKGDHCKFPFRNDDELWDTHLEVAGGNETCPEHRHNISWPNFAVLDKFASEPET